jgi:hypothetical protein
VFPPGYPVARVTEVHKDAVQPLAHVRAVPFAHIDTDSEVMLIWFRPDSPASPLQEHNGELTTGDSNIQPLAVPAKAAQPSQTPPVPKAAADKAGTARKSAATSIKSPGPAGKPERPPT